MPMPFDFQNSKPREIYQPAHGRRRRYWPYPGSIENLAYTPEEIRSWRSVDILPDFGREVTNMTKCMDKCFEKPMNPFYSENYLQEHLMLENPALLTALKNTPIMRNIPTKHVQFGSPHFGQKGKMEQFHLLVPKKYRAAVLCKITDNFYTEQELQDQELVNDKEGTSNIPSKSDTSKLSIYDFSLSNITKSEGLAYGRTKLEETEEREDRQKLDRRLYPSHVELANPTKKKQIPNQDVWDEEGSMEAETINYPGMAIFNESSPSDDLPIEIKSIEELQDLNYSRKSKEVERQIPPEIMSLFLNCPVQNIKTPTSTDQRNTFNHFGLLEEAKGDALENCLKKLYRRDRKVKVPIELLNNTYGRLKGMPVGFIFEKPRLPKNLETNCPALPEELKKVEMAMRQEKLARKNRKARGVQSDAPVARMVEQFSKPTIESAENVSVKVTRKSFMTLDDYPDKYNELNKRDSSDSLFCQAGAVKLEQGNQTNAFKSGRSHNKTQTWVDNLMEKSSAALTQHKILMDKKLISDQKIKLRPIPTVADMSTSSSGNSEEEDENEQNPLMFDVKDSRDSLPYADITFSAIRVPSGVVQIEDNWLYRKLAEDVRSLSSNESKPELDDNEDEEAEEEGDGEMFLNDGISETGLVLDKLFKRGLPHLKRGTKIQINTSAEELVQNESPEEVN